MSQVGLSRLQVTENPIQIILIKKKGSHNQKIRWV